MDSPPPAGVPGPPVPAELRELAGAAEQLAATVRDLQTRLRAADDPTRQAGFRLDVAVGYCDAVAAALTATAESVARVRGRSNCAADWGVCPEHGNSLRSAGGRTWCAAGGCGRSWSYDRGGLPCTEPASSLVTDAEGGTTTLCAGHTLDARTRLIGATVHALSTPDQP